MPSGIIENPTPPRTTGAAVCCRTRSRTVRYQGRKLSWLAK
jgi:hypothetical protein